MLDQRTSRRTTNGRNTCEMTLERTPRQHSSCRVRGASSHRGAYTKVRSCCGTRPSVALRAEEPRWARLSHAAPGTPNREFQTFSGLPWKLQVSKTTTNSRFRNTRLSQNVVLFRGELDSSTPRVSRVFWMVVFESWSLPGKSEKSGKSGECTWARNEPPGRIP